MWVRLGTKYLQPLRLEACPGHTNAHCKTQDTHPADSSPPWRSAEQLRQDQEATDQGGHPTRGMNGGVGSVPHRTGQIGRSAETRDVKDGPQRAGTLNLEEKGLLGARATRICQDLNDPIM